MKHAVVIGSGFAGLAAAASLARKGFRVTVLEKNDQPGGRARTWSEQGFTFELNLSGVADEHRDAFVSKRDTDVTK